jgi:hypothetical protein
MHSLKMIGLGMLCLLAGGCAVIPALWIAGGILSQQNIWYFPGDPPFFDVSIIPSTVALAISGGTVLLTRGSNDRPHFYGLCRLAAATTLALSVAVMSLCLSGIGFRFTPPWRDVRVGIREYGDRIATAAGNKNRVLSTMEFESLRQEYMPVPVDISMPGYGIVQLRMAHGVYPYIGVDFNGASHALFDARTMFCTYSD